MHVPFHAIFVHPPWWAVKPTPIPSTTSSHVALLIIFESEVGRKGKVFLTDEIQVFGMYHFSGKTI